MPRCRMRAHAHFHEASTAAARVRPGCAGAWASTVVTGVKYDKAVATGFWVRRRQWQLAQQQQQRSTCPAPFTRHRHVCCVPSRRPAFVQVHQRRQRAADQGGDDGARDGGGHALAGALLRGVRAALRARAAGPTNAARSHGATRSVCAAGRLLLVAALLPTHACCCCCGHGTTLLCTTGQLHCQLLRAVCFPGQHLAWCSNMALCAALRRMPPSAVPGTAASELRTAHAACCAACPLCCRRRRLRRRLRTSPSATAPSCACMCAASAAGQSAAATSRRRQR